MSIWANIFKSLDIGGPTYWDGKKPPTGGLMGKLGVGQIEKNVKVGDTNLRFQAPDPRKEVDKKASMAAGELVYKKGKKFGQFHRIEDGKITLDEDAWKSWNMKDRPQKKSLVKETVDAEEDTEEEATVPTPPTPPETGQKPDEEDSSSTEGDVKGGTVVADKDLDDSAIKPKVTLMSKYKKKKGLLAAEDQTQMLT
jgi:hypothetical protein